MANPEEYIAIRRWGKMMGSYGYYIQWEQERAAKEQAPITAIFKGTKGWKCAEDIQDKGLRARILK